MKKDNTVIGKKGKERWYPIYAPHIILGTNKSILDYINNWDRHEQIGIKKYINV